MSIFPKRSVRGGSVTIHWNLTLPAGMETAVFPFVRIGIVGPDGVCHLLLEESILLLPSTAGSAPAALPSTDSFLYLQKHTPLLVLASYLAGGQPREVLVDILTNIQNGRHYYFSWPVPADAPPGKYSLLSEMYVDGSLRLSSTASEDFFFIEQLDVVSSAEGAVTIHNPGPERVPVKLISYAADRPERAEALDVFYIEPGDRRVVSTSERCLFLVYNEERITVPLHALGQRRILRNQQLLSVSKVEAGELFTYVLPRTGDAAWRLSGVQRSIWESADGLTCAASLRALDAAAFDELLANKLIIEIP